MKTKRFAAGFEPRTSRCQPRDHHHRQTFSAMTSRRFQKARVGEFKLDLIGRVVPEQVEHQTKAVLDNDAPVAAALHLNDVHLIVLKSQHEHHG